MSNLEPKIFHKEILQYVSSYFNQKNLRNRIHNMSLRVHKKKNKDHKDHNCADHNSNYNKHPIKRLHLSNFVSLIRGKRVIKCTSMLDIMINANKHTKAHQTRNVSSNTILKRNYNPSNSNYVLGVVSQQRFQDTSKFFNYSNLMNWKVYICQLITKRETCCCSCNSDAMFEVMKCLYDCYVMKNCDSCDCMICGHEYVEERRLRELNKSVAALGPGDKSDNKIEDTIVKAEKAMEGKTLAEKEIILKDLAMSGIPLPEGKTASGNSLINKVRTNLGLPIALTADDNCKIKKAAMLGLLQPLDGKTPKEKKNILKDLADMGIPLPEGRTASEKKIVRKVQAATGLPLEALSERLRKVKAKGLLTPLEGKSPAEKERVLRGLGMAGLPLPEGKTPSERKLIKTIRSNLGLPPEPKALTMREKYKHVAEAGLLHPLEGKTPAEKKRILQRFADLGVPLPKGRTLSENTLIAKVKKECLLQYCHHCMYLSKKGKAKAKGLLTPLQGKSPLEKENILKGLANLGMPFPAGTTDSERMLIDSIRTDLGLLPEPKTALMMDKYTKAADLGMLLPLEGKTPKQKEHILRGLADLPLPEGRTAFEKALLATLQKEVQTSSILLPPEKQTEKQRKAKSAGLLTPLKGKSEKQKENIFKGLAYLAMPLPEGTTDSEKKLVNKIRTELGLPLEPTTLEMKDKYKKAADDVLLLAQEGKSLKEKKDILQGLADMGIPLPERRRPPSQNDLEEKFKTIVRPPSVTTVNLRKTKKAGLLTPLAGKPPEEKDTNIIPKNLANIGLLLPKAQTSSEKNTTTAPKKTKAERLKDAKTVDFMTPLTVKTPEQNEKITRGLVNASLPLLDAETPAEKILIGKIYADIGLSPELKAPSMKEKYMKAKAEGLITPLEGNNAAEKEAILKKLQLAGIQVPESRTPGEKSMIKIIKARTPPQRLKAAKEAGVLTHIDGNSAEENENILLGLVEAGVTLPKGRTSSMKEMINKVSYDMGQPSEAETKSMKNKMRRAATVGLVMPLEGKPLPAQADMRIPLPKGRTPSEKSPIEKIKNKAAEKLGKAKFAGLFIPLEGKSPADKEKNVSGLAEMGLPLPKGRTLSEKSLIRTVKADCGVAPSVTTPSEAAIVRKAKAKGLLTPFTGNTLAQKEKYFEVLQKLGCRYLKVRRYQKEFDKKIRAKAGLSTRLTLSEREGKIRKRAIDIGTVSKNLVKGVGGIAKDIVKTTVCDHACGCNKKKIRFKPSYVKIRVTSPNMSFSCSCPEKCIPGAKSGDFVDKEGTKVTVVSGIGVSSHTISREHTSTVSIRENNITNGKTKSYRYSPVRTYANVVPKKSCNKPNCGTYLGAVYSNLIQRVSNRYSYEDFYSDRHVDYASSSPNFSHLAPRLANYYSRKAKSSADSMTSILIVTSDSTLTLSSDGSIDSIVSYTDDSYSDSTIDDSDYITDEINYSTEDSTESNISLRIDKLASITCTESELNTFGSNKRSDFIYSSMFEIKLSSSVYAMKQTTKSGNSLIVINSISSEKDIKAVVDELLSQDVLCDASSVVLLVPASYDQDSKYFLN